jgi:hypothetical protein
MICYTVERYSNRLQTSCQSLRVRTPQWSLYVSVRGKVHAWSIAPRCDAPPAASMFKTQPESYQVLKDLELLVLHFLVDKSLGY